MADEELIPTETPPPEPAPPPVALPTNPIATDVLSGLQAAQPMIQPVPVPVVPTPEHDYQRHMGTLHTILDRVGSALGGGESINITRDADGNVSLTHRPATTGEKWGRIAAAALGGAATGLANSFGPAGMARAGAAGLQFGMQQADQRNERITKEATAEENLALHRANNALIHQNMIRTGLENQGLQMEIDQKHADMLNNTLADLKSRPGANDYGPVSTMEDIQKLAATNPQAVTDHANGALKVVPLPKAGGGVEFHLVSTDPNDDTQPMPEGSKMHVLRADENGKPELQELPVARGTKRGQFMLAEQATYDRYLAAQAKWIQANRPAAGTTGAGRLPANYGQTRAEITRLQARLRDTSLTPDQRQETQAQLQDMQSQLTDLRTFEASKHTGAAAGTPLEPDELQTAAENLSDPATNVTLNSFPIKQRMQILNYMNQHGMSPTHPLTTAEWNRTDLAGNAISNIEEAQRILKARPDLFGPVAGRVTRLRQAMQGGDVDAARFEAAIRTANLPLIGIHGMRGQYALRDVENLDADLYRNPEALAGILDEIHRSAAEFGNRGGRPAPARRGAAPTAAPPAVATPQAPAAAPHFTPDPVQPPRPAHVPPGYVHGTNAQGQQGWSLP